MAYSHVWTTTADGASTTKTADVAHTLRWFPPDFTKKQHKFKVGDRVVAKKGRHWSQKFFDDRGFLKGDYEKEIFEIISVSRGQKDLGIKVPLSKAVCYFNVSEIELYLSPMKRKCFNDD